MVMHSLVNDITINHKMLCLNANDFTGECLAGYFQVIRTRKHPKNPYKKRCVSNSHTALPYFANVATTGS